MATSLQEEQATSFQEEPLSEPSLFFDFEEQPNVSPFLSFEDPSSLSCPPFFTQLEYFLPNSPKISSDLSSPDISSPEQPLSDPILLQCFNYDNEMNVETTGVLDNQNPFMKMQETQVKQNLSEFEKNPPKKGRGKKRQRCDPNESTDISAVSLTREQILSFSSEDLENYVGEITKSRPLTFAEEKELKRLRRLIKNRESAQASRQRKKCYIDELEAEVSKLKQENNILTSQVNNLYTENRSLKEELQKLHTLVKKTGTGLISSLLPKSVFVQNQSKSTEHAVGVSSISTRGPSQKAKAGACLLILLFSFGLFFNTGKNSIKSVNPGNAISRILEPAPAMAAGPAKMFFGGDVREAAGGRKILEAEQKSSEPPLMGQIEKSIPSRSVKSAPYKIVIDEVKQTIDKGTIASSYYEEVHKTREKDVHIGVNFMEFMNESINSNVSEMEDAEVKKWFSDRLRMRPNTAFFSVSEFQQIIPPNMHPFDTNAPFFVSLLIPSRSFSNQLPSKNNEKDKSVIEVIAQVVDVNQTSLNLDEITKIRHVPIVE